VLIAGSVHAQGAEGAPTTHPSWKQSSPFCPWSLPRSCGSRSQSLLLFWHWDTLQNRRKRRFGAYIARANLSALLLKKWGSLGIGYARRWRRRPGAPTAPLHLLTRVNHAWRIDASYSASWGALGSYSYWPKITEKRYANRRQDLSRLFSRTKYNACAWDHCTSAWRMRDGITRQSCSAFTTGSLGIVLQNVILNHHAYCVSELFYRTWLLITYRTWLSIL